MKNKIKMIKRSTGTPSQAESAGRGLKALGTAGVMTLKKLWEKVPEKGLLSYIKKPSVFESKKPTTPSKLPSTSKALVTMDTAKKFKNMQKLAKVVKFARSVTPIGAAFTVASGFGGYEKGKDPQSLAKKAYEKGKSYKVAKEFKTYGADGVKTVKMKSQGGMMVGKQSDYIKDLIK